MGNIFLNNIDTYFCFSCLADVMPNSVNGRCYMPCLECGRCYCQEVDGCPLLFFADVIANGMWQMFLTLQCIATIDCLMLLPSADGIATCCLFVCSTKQLKQK